MNENKFKLAFFGGAVFASIVTECKGIRYKRFGMSDNYEELALCFDYGDENHIEVYLEKDSEEICCCISEGKTVINSECGPIEKIVQLIKEYINAKNVYYLRSIFDAYSRRN